MRKNVIKPGDVVKYSAAFLRSCGMYTGPMPFATGTVREVKRYSETLELATVDWGNPEIPEKVNTGNLILKSRIHLEP